jgi:hypothetical protein
MPRVAIVEARVAFALVEARVAIAVVEARVAIAVVEARVAIAVVEARVALTRVEATVALSRVEAAATLARVDATLMAFLPLSIPQGVIPPTFGGLVSHPAAHMAPENPFFWSNPLFFHDPSRLQPQFCTDISGKDIQIHTFLAYSQNMYSEGMLKRGHKSPATLKLEY